MKSHWREHNGKRIFIADYSNFGEDSAALQKECDEIVDALRRESVNSVRAISIVEGTTASFANVQVLMDLLPQSNAYVFKRCVIGATGTRWRFIETFNRLTGRAPLRPFSTLVDALEWIAQD